MSKYVLHNVDCLEFMRTMLDKSVDAVITDPPYGIDYQSAWRTDKAQWKPKIQNDKEPFVEWIKDAYRITKDGGVLMCFYRWDVGEVFRQTVLNVGYDVKSEIIWDKVVHGMGDLEGAFAPCHENILFATKGKFVFPGDRPKTIIRQKRVDAEKMIHPNEKPVALLEYLIRHVTSHGETLFEPFAGSGSCAEACQRTGREFIGTEIDPHYFNIAERRISLAARQEVMFE
jgi:DNA modification methylase